MTDRIEFTPDYGAKENSSIIKVIGVGGGGSNAVKHMYSEGIVGVDFLVCNTDQGHLEKNPIPDKLLLGNGLGAGARPEVASQFATESREKIREFIGKNTKMLFITAGMGKGTGTGASPVIAEIAKEMGILTIGVVTYPFNFEGKQRRKFADMGIQELNKHVDSLIVVKNNNILTYYKDQSIMKAYGYADDVLKNAVKCIAELITVDNFQNVDFNDVQTVMKNSGKAMLGIATASGEDRINKVVDDALNCPLLDTTVINDAQNFLFFINYGPDSDFSAAELDLLTQRFESLQSDEAEIIWGQGVDETLGDAIKLSVIITNFSAENEQTKINHVFVENNNDNSESFKTQQIIGNRIEEKPITISTPAQPHNPSSSSQNDIDSLFSSNKPANTPVADHSTSNAGDAIVFDFQGDNVIAQQPQQPTNSKIELQDDPIFRDDQDFFEKTSIPTFLRMNSARTSTMSAATQTATMERQRQYEVANDIKDFFVDAAD